MLTAEGIGVPVVEAWDVVGLHEGVEGRRVGDDLFLWFEDFLHTEEDSWAAAVEVDLVFVMF
jgi:hypothetical protein